MKMDMLSPEERNEWDTLLGDALNGSRTVDDAAVTRAESMLADAQQAHQPWASVIVRSLILRGLRAALNAKSKSESVALVSYNGTHVAKTTRLGTKRRRHDGSLESQQVLLHEMSWDELGAWLNMIKSQISSLLVNESMAQRLMPLRDRFPDTFGPREACDLLGMTVDEYLAA